MSYNLLAGKVGVIFGALNEQSIAWRVAERAIEEGAKIVLTNTAMAIRMGNLNELAAKIGATVVPADATSGFRASIPCSDGDFRSSCGLRPTLNRYEP